MALARHQGARHGGVDVRHGALRPQAPAAHGKFLVLGCFFVLSVLRLRAAGYRAQLFAEQKAAGSEDLVRSFAPDLPRPSAALKAGQPAGGDEDPEPNEGDGDVRRRPGVSQLRLTTCKIGLLTKSFNLTLMRTQ